MLTLLALGAAAVLLIIGFGLPYQQTWYSRWGNHGR